MRIIELKHDFTGKKVGKLTVIGRKPDKRQGTWWLCECECGEMRVVRSDKLRDSIITCCEKCKPQYKDMTGKKFGRLTVLSYAGPNHRKDATWLCKCEYGTEKVIQGQALRSGAVVSCGCYSAEKTATHHGSKDRLYCIWHGMRSRCNNQNDKSFKYYGAKGVEVCEEWESDYGKFREWAMANGYDPDAEFQQCTLDRINPFGNYEPGNCRWVDIVTQERNRRDAYARENDLGGNVLAAHASTS